MKFLELSVTNFMSWGKAVVPLSDQGLVLVQGVNGDSTVCGSNGSGKSSLFVDAWLWVLYGKTARGLSGDGVVRKNSSGCWCTLEFADVSGTTYRVKRFQGHPESGNGLFLEELKVKGFERPGSQGSTSFWVDISKPDKRDTQAEIERLLGFPMKVALNAMVLGQNSIAFATMTDAEKKSTLEEVLGFDRLTRAQKRAKEKLSLTEGDLSSKTVLIDSYTEQKESLQKELAQLEKDSKEWEEEQEILGRELISQQDENDRRQVTLRGYLINAQKELDETIQHQFRVVKQNTQVIEDMREIEGEIRVESATVPSEEEGKHLEGERSRSVGLLASAQTRSNLYVKEALLKHNKVASRKIPETCPTCKQKLPEESIEAVRASFNNDIQIAVRELETAHSEAMCVTTQVMDQLVRDSAEIYLFQKEREKVGPIFDKLDGKLKYRIKRSAQLTLSISEITKSADEIRLNLSECDTEIIGCDIERTRIETQLNSRPENPHTKPIQSVTARGAEVIRKLISAQDGFDQLKMNARLYRFWSRGFGKDGIQSYMLDSLVPFLNEQVNKYAEILLEGEVAVHFKTQRLLADGETLKEDFHVSVNNKYGADVYKGNSAGEQERVDICIALGLQDLVISRQGEGFSLCILDEVARHIDQEGVELYYQLLSQLSRERSSTFVITHSPHLESLFSRIWTTRKEGGVSKLEVV